MINYDYYRIFYFVATYKSFTKAAEALNNNQPNITRCMNNLETELNCKLFIRSNRGISLTPEGERLFKHISVAYKQISLGEEELKNELSLNKGSISIASSESSLNLILLDNIAEFHEKYPNIHIRLVNSYTSDAMYQLENGLIDVAVLTMPLKYPKTLKCIPVKSVKETLICGSQYLEYTLRPHNLSDVAKLPFISLGKKTVTREIHANYFAEHNLVFLPDIEAGTVHQILPIVQKNLGVAFFPEEMAKKAIKAGVVYEIPIKDGFPKREICIMFNPNASQSVSVKILCSLIMKNCQLKQNIVL